jgi:hypothetical protein
MQQNQPESQPLRRISRARWWLWTILLTVPNLVVGLNIAKVSYGARAALESGFALHREV